VYELSGSNIHRTKNTDMKSGWLLQNYRVFFFRWDPHDTSRSVLLEVTLVNRPYVSIVIFTQLNEFFLKASWATGSPLEITGRGLRWRNPNLWNNRCAWRTPIKRWYFSWRWWLNNLPSHKFWGYPNSLGFFRKSLSISATILSDTRDGLPDRGSSYSPSNPLSLNKCTQLSIVVEECPKISATS